MCATAIILTCLAALTGDTPEGQLKSTLDGEGLKTEYVYDDGARLAAVYRGTSLDFSFAHDGEQMVAAYGATGATAWEAAWGPGVDQLLEWRDFAGVTGEHVPLLDHRNSVVATWDAASGRVGQTAEYNPDGRLTLRSAAGAVLCDEVATGQTCAAPAGMPFGFSSAWRSARSGLVSMRARWYSPGLGQFLSQGCDPKEPGWTRTFGRLALSPPLPVGCEGRYPTASQVGWMRELPVIACHHRPAWGPLPPRSPTTPLIA